MSLKDLTQEQKDKLKLHKDEKKNIYKYELPQVPEDFKKAIVRPQWESQLFNEVDAKKHLEDAENAYSKVKLDNLPEYYREKNGLAMQTKELVEKILKVTKEQTLEAMKNVKTEYDAAIEQAINIQNKCNEIDLEFYDAFKLAKEQYEKEELLLDD